MTGFYVTMKRGNRTGWLFGPVADHGVALAMVDPVRRLACRIDPWCDFDAFGTSSITTDKQFPPRTGFTAASNGSRRHKR